MNKGSFYFPYQAVSYNLDLFDLTGLPFPGYSFLQNPSNVDQSTLSNCKVIIAYDFLIVKELARCRFSLSQVSRP